MIRIHGGKYKGQFINTVPVDSTRETASMVREAVFNSLYQVEGKVLDLFAGSGSYGITALSLGANEAFFIDNNFVAVKTLTENINKLKIENAKIIKTDYQSFLKSNLIKFDLIFLDPPYKFDSYEIIMNNLKNHLNEEARIVLEVNKNTKINEIKGYTLVKEGIYGIKKVLIYKNNALVF